MIPSKRMKGEPAIVLFSVDTEPDDQWSDHLGTSVHNVAGLWRFQELLDKLDVIPTYLVTHSVATNSAAMNALATLQRNHSCEIGAHLHVWDNPPFLHDERDRQSPAFGHELPLEHFHAKLDTLTHRIAEHFDRPTSYRAGRFGFCAEHIGVLESLGYRVDTSVTPLLDRRPKTGIPKDQGGSGGRDFRQAPLDPYFPNYRNELEPGSAALMEVPLTAGICGPAAAFGNALHRYAPKWLCKSMRKLGLAKVVTASPVQFRAADLLQLLGGALRDGRRVFNFTLHSSETMAGGSPELQTEDDILALFSRIRIAVEFLKDRVEITSCPLTMLAAERESLSARELNPQSKLIPAAI